MGRSRTPSHSSVPTVRLADSSVNSAKTLYGPGQEPHLHQAETTALDRIRAKTARDSGTLSGTVRPGTQRTRFADFFTRRTKATGTQATNPNNNFEQLRRERMTRYPVNITLGHALESTQTHQAADRSRVQYRPAITASCGGPHIEDIMTAIAREYIRSIIGSQQPVYSPFNARSLASPSALPGKRVSYLWSYPNLPSPIHPSSQLAPRMVSTDLEPRMLVEPLSQDLPPSNTSTAPLPRSTWVVMPEPLTAQNLTKLIR